MNKLATFGMGALVGGVVVLVAVIVLGVVWKNSRAEADIRDRERLLGINCKNTAARAKEVIERYTPEIVRAVRSNKYKEGGAVPIPIESGTQVVLRAELSALLSASRECEKLQAYARSAGVKSEGDFHKLSEILHTLDVLMISPLSPQSPERRATWLQMAGQAEDMQRDFALSAAQSGASR